MSAPVEVAPVAVGSSSTDHAAPPLPAGSKKSSNQGEFGFWVYETTTTS